VPTDLPDIHVVNHFSTSVADDIAALPGISLTDLAGDADVPGDLRADVVLTNTWGSANLPELLQRGVKWVQVMGVGVDNFPLDALADEQVLTCARGATAIPIGEFALASMMSFAKAMPDVWLDGPPEHGWYTGPKLSGLYGKTLVVVGVGGIGSRVASIALAFGMRVIGVRRRPLPSPLAGMEIATDLRAAVTNADHLVLAAPATDDTSHMVNAEVLAAAKPGLHLVNVARGSLVDQDALRVALDNGQVARASLDTVTPEPLPDGSWMYSHPGVRISPHVSWAGPGSRTAMADAFIANYHRFRSGETLEGIVDRTLGY
jgi:phosphoglycerate dehydrogenase-like enzyme